MFCFILKIAESLEQHDLLEESNRQSGMCITANVEKHFEVSTLFDFDQLS